MNKFNHKPTKGTAIRVTVVSLLAVIAAIVLCVVSIQKNEYWATVFSVIMAISLFDYSRYVWNQSKETHSDNKTN